MARETFQFLIGVFGGAEDHQFHLVELVLSDEAAGVFPIGAGFAPEAGRMRGVSEGEDVLGQGFFAVQVRQRHLGCRNQEVIIVAQAKEVVLELRQLAGSGHAGTIHHEGREDLPVSMGRGMQVQHEIDQRAFQARARSARNRKPGAGHARRPFEIQDAQRFSDVPVRFGGKRERGRSAPPPYLRIGAGIRAGRDGLVRNVGNPERDGVQPLFGVSQGIFKGLDAVSDIPRLLHERVRRLLLPLEFGDLI